MDVAFLIGEELRARPAAAPADLYKLLHQAILGPGHLVSDPAAARAALDRELATASAPLPDEAVIEGLDPTTGTVRLSLRKWKFLHGTSEELQQIFLASAERVGQGDRARLARCLDEAIAALPSFGLDPAPLASFIAARKDDGFPPVSHSAAYREAYRPSYRVVLRAFLPSWITAPPPSTG